MRQQSGTFQSNEKHRERNSDGIHATCRYFGVRHTLTLAEKAYRAAKENWE